MNHRFFVFILSASLALPVFAKETSEPPKGIHIRALASALSGNLETLNLREAEQDLGEIKLETATLGDRDSVPVRQFTFGLNQPDGSFRSLGMVTLPEAGHDFILVFAPIKDSYQVFPIRTDDPEFRGSDSILFNFTPFKIRAIVGGITKQIASMQHEPLRPIYNKGDTTYQANFAYEKNDKMIPFNNTRWLVNPNLKTLVFIYLNPETQKPAYRAVSTLAVE